MINDNAQLAWQIIESTGTSLFLTGRAGTGKTTFLRRLMSNTSKCAVVVAPTGIAALNAGGVTMHSFFQLPFAPYVPGTSGAAMSQQMRMGSEKRRIMRAIDLLVIDEISMVRADVLDSVDSVLRHYRHDSRPFGGVQLLMIGDLGQLAPVAKDDEWQLLSRFYATPYFFSSNALARMHYAVVELDHVYRQADSTFVELLNKIRDNKADQSVLDMLNSRYMPGFDADAVEGCIRLTTHNVQAQRINAAKLDELPGQRYVYDASIDGRFPDYLFPTDERLVLKANAQVMFVKNDSSPEKRYYNGMIGIVTDIDERGFSVRPNDGGDEIEVEPETWENTRYELNEQTKEVNEVVDGFFKQFPVKTAWAITVHKSQGLTFDRAVIDVSHSFAHGQTYVALSRCRTLEGMVLSAPLRPSAIIRDTAVDGYVNGCRSLMPDADALDRMRQSYYVATLDELFDFSTITEPFYSLMRIVNEHLAKRYPKLALEYKARNSLMNAEMTDVAAKFHRQYGRMVLDNDDYETNADIDARIRKGAGYFFDKVSELAIFIAKADVETDNKEVARRWSESMDHVRKSLKTKSRLLRNVIDNGFGVTAYMRERTRALLDNDDDDNDTPKQRRRRKQSPLRLADVGESTPTADNKSVDEKREVVDALVEWRRSKMRELGIPAYCILHQVTIDDIAEAMPETIEQLKRIPRIGEGKATKYGDEILNVLKRLSRT